MERRLNAHPNAQREISVHMHEFSEHLIGRKFLLHTYREGKFVYSYRERPSWKNGDILVNRWGSMCVRALTRGLVRKLKSCPGRLLLPMAVHGAMIWSGILGDSFHRLFLVIRFYRGAFTHVKLMHLILTCSLLQVTISYPSSMFLRNVAHSDHSLLWSYCIQSVDWLFESDWKAKLLRQVFFQCSSIQWK